MYLPMSTPLQTEEQAALSSCEPNPAELSELITLSNKLPIHLANIIAEWNQEVDHASNDATRTVTSVTRRLKRACFGFRAIRGEAHWADLCTISSPPHRRSLNELAIVIASGSYA